MQNEITAISGTVNKITYRNEMNGYTIAEVSLKDSEITVVGILPFLNIGDTGEFFGEYTVHSTYGQQFKANAFDKKLPENTADILKYLSSGAIKGIGPATALKITEKFGSETLDIIAEHPERLAEIKGISQEKANAISYEYMKQHGVREIMLFLSKYGISPDKCLNIYKIFGSGAVEIIKKNPYSLCISEIDIGFEIAEDIAAELGFEKDCETRISSGLLYVLRKNLANGHTCLPRKKLIEVSVKLLDCKADTAEICLDSLIDTMQIYDFNVNSSEFVALPEYYRAEQYIASRLHTIKDNTPNDYIDEFELEFLEKQMGIEFETLQKQAILSAFQNGILILTGGPGTGKTTTLNAIIKLIESRNLKIELAAPTGRAAKRMTEITGKEAQTIHRLLEVDWSDEATHKFVRNEKNPLDCDVLILDEASMIDSILFSDILKALRLSCRIILVGDSDQLPSISAGNILGDILASDIFPSIRLKKVFRQANESLIVRNAHAIINEEPADFKNMNSDCFFLDRSDKYSVVSTICDLCFERLPSAYKINPLTDIQVLCPSKMLDTGTVNINNVLQETLNPHKKGMPQVFYKGFAMRVGDKVMQIKNNYDLAFTKDDGKTGNGVFNGDVGFITDIDLSSGVLKVRYDDKVVNYYSEDMNQLELAYAVTVHKSQGSEYDYVIIPLFDIPSKLKYRNLLYTAVTRAKKMLILVGKEEIWYQMALNNKKTLRYTMLNNFLREKNNGYF